MGPNHVEFGHACRGVVSLLQVAAARIRALHTRVWFAAQYGWKFRAASALFHGIGPTE
jgi:hypothetical protein